MAVTHFYSLETRAALSEGVTLGSNMAISTNQARTGSASLRVNPASGAAGVAASTFGVVERYVHFGLYIATMPSVGRMIGGSASAGAVNIMLNSNGTISYRDGTTVLGTSSTALQTGQWYWIGWKNTTGSGTSIPLVQIDGITEVTATSTGGSLSSFGCAGTEASAIDLYYDDIIFDDAGFIDPSKVALLVPISDGTIGVGWMNDAGNGTPIFDAIDNAPPVGIADTVASTGLHQIRHSTNNAGSAAPFNLTTYSTAGVGASDTILAVQPIAMTAAPSATSPKSGSLTLSNPTIAKTTIGTFYNGTAIASTFPTGWIRRSLAVLTSPTGITLGNSPVLTVTNDTGSTRIGMVCFMGLAVVWTPAVGGGGGGTDGWDPTGMLGVFGL